MFKTVSRLAAQWRANRNLRRTKALLENLPPAVRSDIGFPAIDLFLDGRTRFLRH